MRVTAAPLPPDLLQFQRDAMLCSKLLYGILRLAAVGLLAAVWQWRSFLAKIRPPVLEPEGLAAAVWDLPMRDLSAAELETYRRDGVLIVRGAVPHKALPKSVKAGLQQHQTFHEVGYPRSWEFNGVVRALLRDGPLRNLLEQVAQTDYFQLEEAPIWGGAMVHNEYASSGWHMDASLHDDEHQLFTLWMPVTPAPHSLEFLRGSHVGTVNKPLYLECNESHRHPNLVRILTPSCVKKFAGEKITPKLGYQSQFWADLDVGDAVFFHGQLVHRGWKWPADRTAISARVSPSLQRTYQCLAPLPPNGVPVQFMGSNKTPDPFNCTSYRMLARHPRVWPMLYDRLPREDLWGRHAWAPRFVRRLLVAALHMALGVSA